MKKNAPDNYRVLDTLMEGIQLIGFDWQYLYINDTTERQSKYKKEELLGHTMMEKYPGIEHTPMFKVLEACMRERCSRVIENEFVFPDGTKGLFELHIQPVPEGLFIRSEDITEKKGMEKEKQQYVDGLEEMLHLVSHHLRQPITNILGLLDLLQGPSGPIKDFGKVVSYIQQSAMDLDILSSELILFIHDLKKKAKPSQDC